MRILYRALLIFLVLFLAACQAVGFRLSPAPTTPLTRVAPIAKNGGQDSLVTVESSAHPTAILPTQTPPATQTDPSPSATPSRQDGIARGEPTADPIGVGPMPFQLRWLPDGPLYVGDQLSLEVLPGAGQDLAGQTIEIHAETANGDQMLGSASFEPFGLGNRTQATLWWFWDTKDLSPGEKRITLKLLPAGSSWPAQVSLLPASDLPDLEASARWATATTACCEIHYLTGSAAERDLDNLSSMIDAFAADVSDRLGYRAEEKISLVLMPRVLGHGGFTGQDITVSYLDRNYAGNGSDMVLHHEIAHWIDGKLGGELRPTLLVEGLAVYLSGGHFKPELLMARAAALLPPQAGCTPVDFPGIQDDTSAQQGVQPCSLDRFIALADLADNFYPSQHEIGYLQAGALVEYMVKTWGWEAFNAFYRDIHPPPKTDGAPQNPGQAQAIDTALQKHFSRTLEELETDFIAALRQERLTAAAVQDVQLSVEYFDSVRRYQQLLDPSAYFLYAWLADGAEMRKRGITADYLRHPERPENLALELMFGNADRALRAGELSAAAAWLADINAVLALFPAAGLEAFSVTPRASDFYALATAAQDAGYQPQRIELADSQARVWVTAYGSELVQVDFERGQGGWRMLQASGSSWMPSLFSAVAIMDRYTAS